MNPLVAFVLGGTLLIGVAFFCIGIHAIFLAHPGKGASEYVQNVVDRLRGWRADRIADRRGRGLV